MRRIKVILAVVAAVAAMTALAAPAMALEVDGGTCTGFCAFGTSSGGGDHDVTLGGNTFDLGDEDLVFLSGVDDGDVVFDGISIDDAEVEPGGFILLGSA